MALGLLATCVLKVRRVSRDYVEGQEKTVRVKENYAESDDEEDTDCAVDRSRVGTFQDAHRFNEQSSAKKLWILASQIEPLVVQDQMYLFLFFGHMVSKLLDHSLLPTFVMWTSSFGQELDHAK